MCYGVEGNNAFVDLSKHCEKFLTELTEALLLSVVVNESLCTRRFIRTNNYDIKYCFEVDKYTQRSLYFRGLELEWSLR